jgi:hypothetical protein
MYLNILVAIMIEKKLTKYDKMVHMIGYKT